MLQPTMCLIISTSTCWEEGRLQRRRSIRSFARSGAAIKITINGYLSKKLNASDLSSLKNIVSSTCVLPTMNDYTELIIDKYYCR